MISIYASFVPVNSNDQGSSEGPAGQFFLMYDYFQGNQTGTLGCNPFLTEKAEPPLIDAIDGDQQCLNLYP